jgi:hypothetical protein
LFFDSNRSQTFTADAGTDVCNSSQHMLETGDLVQASTTTALPTGLAATTDYFAIRLTPNTFKLAVSAELANAGTAIDLTTAGTGTHTFTEMPLNGVAGPYEIHLYRNTHASASHCMHAKMMLPNGGWLPLSRQPANLTTNYFLLQIKTTTADAGGVTIDGVYREVSTVVNN